MAAEMGFMMVIGIFPFMLFLTAVFGWMGNKSLMDPILAFLSTFMPEQAMELIITVLSEDDIFPWKTYGDYWFLCNACSLY